MNNYFSFYDRFLLTIWTGISFQLPKDPKFLNLALVAVSIKTWREFALESESRHQILWKMNEKYIYETVLPLKY